jgi:hypothetical protein
MVELIKNRVFIFDNLRKERDEHFADSVRDFQINLCLLELVEENEKFKRLKLLEVTRTDGEVVEFLNIPSESGQMKKIRCSNVMFRIE